MIEPLLLRFNRRQCQHADAPLAIDHIKREWQTAVSIVAVDDGLKVATDAMTTILDACDRDSFKALPELRTKPNMIASKLPKETRDTIERAKRLNICDTQHYVRFVEEEIVRLSSITVSITIDS